MLPIGTPITMPSRAKKITGGGGMLSKGRTVHPEPSPPPPPPPSPRRSSSASLRRSPPAPLPPVVYARAASAPLSPGLPPVIYLPPPAAPRPLCTRGIYQGAYGICYHAAVLNGILLSPRLLNVLKGKLREYVQQMDAPERQTFLADIAYSSCLVPSQTPQSPHVQEASRAAYAVLMRLAYKIMCDYRVDDVYKFTQLGNPTLKGGFSLNALKTTLKLMYGRQYSERVFYTSIEGMREGFVAAPAAHIVVITCNDKVRYMLPKEMDTKWRCSDGILLPSDVKRAAELAVGYELDHAAIGLSFRDTHVTLKTHAVLGTFCGIGAQRRPVVVNSNSPESVLDVNWLDDADLKTTLRIPYRVINRIWIDYLVFVNKALVRPIHMEDGVCPFAEFEARRAGVRGGEGLHYASGRPRLRPASRCG